MKYLYKLLSLITFFLGDLCWKGFSRFVTSEHLGYVFYNAYQYFMNTSAALDEKHPPSLIWKQSKK